MSGQPARRAGAAGSTAGGRPTLFVVTTCGACREQVAQVRDRAGQPVLLALGPDGKALRDPAGPWWAAKVGEQWRVVQPMPGEDPPAGGWRYAEHGCGRAGGAVQLLAERLGAEPVPPAPARPTPLHRRRQAEPAAPAGPAVRREHPPDRRSPVWVATRGCPFLECGCCPGPVGKGHFIPGSKKKPDQIARECRLPHPATGRECRLLYPSDVRACPERKMLPQVREGGRPAGKSCVDCGRVTERVYVGDALPWAKGVPLPWCGGEFPDDAEPTP